ncbi:hypothetical protein [Anaerotignum propionicum]|uniref:hypothetical protein n=1 Tax=Anaerotignum propionicum TaxID=28446 RepID=UPI0028A28B00|nr:hypothetical protein [Anaerotignum propionicum]
MENQKEMEQSEIVRLFNSMGFFCGDDEKLIQRLEEQEKQERKKGCQLCNMF